MTRGYRTVRRVSPNDAVTFALPDGTAEGGVVTAVEDTDTYREVRVETPAGDRYLLDVIETLDTEMVGIDRWDPAAATWQPVGETAQVTPHPGQMDPPAPATERAGRPRGDERRRVEPRADR